MAEEEVVEQTENEAPQDEAPQEEPKAEEAPKAEEPQEEPKEQAFWNEDWRTKMAEHAAAGDKKIFDKEMKRLQRFTDPTAIYSGYREAESKLTSGTLTKVPGKDATEEEIKAFHKTLGVPEKPEELVSNLELPDGVTLGKQDKALASEFAENMHAAGFTQNQMNTAFAWYLKNEEERSAYVDETDDANKQKFSKELKEEFGGSFKRNMNAMGELFTMAPGGKNLDNEGALINRLLGGRMADGTIIGDDPDMTRFLVTLATEINPVSTVVDDPGGSGKGIEDEIKDIEGIMRTDRRSYNKNSQMQQRYLELLGAQEKMKGK